MTQAGLADRIQAALTRLDELDGVDIHAHPDVYAAVHGELRDVLTAVDNDTATGR